MIKLYKKNGNKVQEWSIEVDGDKYRTSEGFVGGAITTTEWTVAKPKNVGRKNATTGEEQAMLEAHAKVKLKRDKGYVDDESGEGEARFEPMLAHKYEDHLKKLAPYIVSDDTCMLGLECSIYSQPKLDGMRCNAIVEPIHTYANDINLYSRQGKPINNVKHIEKALLPIIEEFPGLVIDGELYNHDLKDDFNTIISHTRKSKPTADDEKESAKVIQYHIYDMYDPSQPELNFYERSRWLHDHLNDVPGIVLVLTHQVFTQAQMDELYSGYREAGYEGQMLRLDVPYVQGRTHNLLKRKEFQDAEYEILDILEGVGNRSGMMGKFILKAGDETFESNGLGNQEYYRELLQNKNEYIGKSATIRYQNLTPRGVPRFPCVVAIRDYE